ncbi:hypothetical protein [Roseomonas xinghualingensis]|uniref:hypothetical protein n=1 Tax=Roseomonas xinghualingensis TaxID=2986475 RepID=UPI0021F20B1F|nr:hypothetical protein [Roseomonas sp. SXEYE001]MCV4209358.1 hypothetical protein [Roseomonas sp. SXEYE001]
MSETVERVVCLVAEDGMLSRVAMGDEAALLDAAEVEALIWKLAACRAAMLPKRTGFLFEGSRINLGEAVRVTTDADGRDIIAVMHPGVGWVGAFDTIRPRPSGGRQRRAAARRQA